MLAPAPGLAPRALVRLEGVEQFFDRRIRILGPLDLDVRAGEFLTLVGPSGCGKSTVLRLVCGVLRPTRGTIRVGERPLQAVNRQAAMVAYIDDFYMMMWMSLAAIPMVLLMRRSSGRAPSAGADAMGH